MSHYQYSNIEELFKLANDSSVPQSRPGSSNPAHPGESAGLPLGSWPGSIPQSLEDPHIGNSEPSFGRVSPASTPLPASLKEDETLDERESSGANSKRNAVTSLPGNPKRARLDATDTPGASTRARPDSGARDRGSFSAPNMAKGGTPTANGTKRSGDSNWRSTGTLRAALPDRHFGSGKKPAASFYSDFLDLLNPSPSPKTPSSKPKKLVALSKRSLNTYQFREEINAEALRTQVAANQALIQLKKDESAEVEYANKLREANVNEAKSNQPQQRRGVANQPGNGANFFEVVYPGQKRQWRKFSKDLFT